VKAAVLSLLTATIILAGWGCYRRRRIAEPVTTPEPAPPVESIPSAEGFELHVVPPARLGEEKLVVAGRLAVFVKDGEQYATWRQFPGAIRFRMLRAPAGIRHEFADLTLNISDTNQVYANYAGMPSNRIVGKDFEMNLLPSYPAVFNVPGIYEIDAEYGGQRSNPVTITLEP
jgi:hypothetical protein